MIGAVCPWHSGQGGVPSAPPPAYTNLGISNKLRKGSGAAQHSSGSACYKMKQSPVEQQVCKYRRLLLLEEAAMEDQIRRQADLNLLRKKSLAADNGSTTVSACCTHDRHLSSCAGMTFTMCDFALPSSNPARGHNTEVTRPFPSLAQILSSHLSQHCRERPTGGHS